jgi:hypothetical protein
MQRNVEISFDCLPLRSVARLDVPLDASPALRLRHQRLQQAIQRHGASNAYFLYNTRCVFRLANSQVENMLRFSFDGVVLTDRSDRRADRAELTIELQAATCPPPSAEVLSWLRLVVERAVLIEFDHFIDAGSLDQRVSELDQVESLADIRDFAGLHL